MTSDTITCSDSNTNTHSSLRASLDLNVAVLAEITPPVRGAAGIWGPGPKAFMWGFGKSSGLSLQTHWEIMASRHTGRVAESGGGPSLTDTKEGV